MLDLKNDLISFSELWIFLEKQTINYFDFAISLTDFIFNLFKFFCVLLIKSFIIKSIESLTI